MKREDNLHLSQSHLNEEVGKMERGLTLLEIAAGAAPLLGLLGTVLGMVDIFSVVSEAGVGNPLLLSKGISKALNTTVFGLIVAIPAFTAFTLYERKIEKLVLLIDQCATQTFTKIYSLEKS